MMLKHKSKGATEGEKYVYRWDQTTRNWVAVTINKILVANAPGWQSEPRTETTISPMFMTQSPCFRTWRGNDVPSNTLLSVRDAAVCDLRPHVLYLQ